MKNRRRGARSLMGAVLCLLLFFLAPVTTTSAAEATVEGFSVNDYLMNEAREIALAKSAAPDFVSDHASVMVLRDTGYETIIEGSNGFVCLVLRSWGESRFDPKLAYDPTTVDPECLNASAASSILPMQLHRTKLGLKGTPADKIKTQIQAGFRDGRFERAKDGAFSYMMSLGMPKHPPHIMFYLPDGSSDETFGNSGKSARVVYVIGGDDEAYIAAVVLQKERGIDPEYPD